VTQKNDLFHSTYITPPSFLSSLSSYQHKTVMRQAVAHHDKVVITDMSKEKKKRKKKSAEEKEAEKEKEREAVRPFSPFLLVMGGGGRMWVYLFSSLRPRPLSA